MVVSEKKSLQDLLIDRGLLTQEQMKTVLDAQRRTGKKLGEILTEEGLLSEEEVLKALHAQMRLIEKKNGIRLGSFLVEEGLVSKLEILRVLEKQLGVLSVDLETIYISPEVAKLIPEELARKYTLIPVQVLNGELFIAMKDPLDYFALDDIKLVLDMPFKPLIALEKDIVITVDKFYGKKVAQQAVDEFVKQYNLDKIEEIDENQDVNGAPIVRFVNSLIENAILSSASDIHIEPEENDVRIRYRIDGILYENMRIGINTLSAVSSRVKIMANLNIAEKRLPQDGRVSYSLEDKNVDVRVSIVPTIHGEKLVMRILDKTNFIMSKDKLGLNQEDLVHYDNLIRKPYGIILVTGPTGSGKTTTLYTALSELNNSQKNIITLEDPVEYHLKGVNQIQLNTKIGLTFASGLRAVLRQDPDIIMLGEIRDEETAEIAVQSALTGHLVLSTLHTNDAASSITRLKDMGIDPFLISSSLLGVIAQRLVRRICPHCKYKYKPDDRELRIIGVKDSNTFLYKGKGCDLCNHSGYKGRIGLFEIMEITREHRDLIDAKEGAEKIRDLSIQNGMVSLNESCKELVRKGITTVEEMVRVTLVN